MNTSLKVQATAVSENTRYSYPRLFLLKKSLIAMKTLLPAAVLAAFFPDVVIAAGAGKDLMQSGDASVKATFGSDSSIVKWVVLAEVLVGAIMYMMTKNVKFLAGFAILSVFIAIGMSVAGY
ncbi:type IV conjugative transfer system pilin TraA [Rahnella bruchi]|jgi:type IV conjugative transfer system pilin TraA|uniref:type IV conjugative transfer system pilin TraA n=1 Tax=Rahnella bruchi TaxID=1510573 RepID=UPI000EA0A066|nr:type IV conjugative transfer system pilin TraA [Rahnella bruchi]